MKNALLKVDKTFSKNPMLCPAAINFSFFVEIAS